MLHLEFVQHKHPTIDLPSWMARLWGLRFAPIPILGYSVGTISGLRGWAFPAAYVGIILVVRYCLRVGAYRSSSGRSVGREPENASLPVGVVLTCHGNPRELAALRGIEAEFFEPVVLPYFAASRSKVEWLMAVGGLLALVVSTGYFRLSVPVTACAVVVAVLLCSMVRYILPAYYRVVPGRVEILQGGMFRSRVRLTGSISLRQATIVCRYDKRTLEITTLSTGQDEHDQVHDTTEELHRPSSVTIDISALMQPHAFVQAVFRGAICTDPVPPLPRDELLG